MSNRRWWFYYVISIWNAFLLGVSLLEKNWTMVAVFGFLVVANALIDRSALRR